MKELYMLTGIGLGMVAGIMLYRYCDGCKQFVDKTEKSLVKEADKLEKQAKKGLDDITKKAKQKSKSASKKI